jgi:hypothetical protein
MSARHYRLLPGLVASLSLTIAACDTARPPDTIAAAGKPQAAALKAALSEAQDFDATIWTVLGMSKTNVERNMGPPTGSTVSPVLWQAALETLHFAGSTSEDSMAGVLVTKWYQPPSKTDERLRVTVFIKSRALRSDSFVVSVERQTISPGGWQTASVATDVATGIESAILLRAQQIHAERYRNTMYN